MKELRKLRRLAVVFAASLLCLIGILVYQYVKQVRTDESLMTDNLMICEMKDVRELSIQTEEGDEIHFSYRGSNQFNGGSHNGTMFAPEQLQQSLVDSTVQQVIAFRIDKRIDEPTELNNYGLVQGCTRITITSADGASHVLLVGSLLPNKDGVYVKLEGEASVLIADYSIYELTCMQFDHYLSACVISLDRTSIAKIDFQRTSTGDHWSMKPLEDADNGLYKEHRYKVTEPLEQEPTDIMIQLFEQIIQLQASEYLPIAKEEYPSYGLDQPEFHFAISQVNGEVIDIYLSMEIAGYYYGYSSDNPYTFRILTQLLPGIEIPTFDLLEAYVRQDYLNQVSKVRVTIKDTEFAMQYEISDVQASITSDSIKILLNQRDAKVYSSDGHCYGLVLFDSIFLMPIREIDTDTKPELTNIEATISVTRVDSTIYTIKLVPKDSDSFYCFIDDRYTGYIVDRSVLYKDNGSNLENFGILDAYVLTNEAIDHQNVDKIYDRP